MSGASRKRRVGSREEGPGKNRGRTLAVKLLLLVAFGAVAARLVKVQVVDADYYQEIARRQNENRIELPASRGGIYDRNGRMTVSSTMDVSFAADPRMLGDKIPVVAKTFSEVFGHSFERYHRKLSPMASNFVWLERHVSRELADRINLKDVDGLVRREEQKRVHHYGHVGGQLIGFTDIDCKGISGIELQFDGELRGRAGMEVRKRDGLGRALPAVDHPRVEPTNGLNLMLTMDIDYQAIAEEALREGVVEHGAEGGLVVMLDPNTGEILAMANYPLIDPADPGKEDQANTRNRTITDMFEPGSVFKVVTAAAALEHHIVSPEQRFFAENGVYHVPLRNGKERIIRDIHEYGMLTVQEGMEFSSNIVMAKISDRIGSELLYRTARDFGFGTRTGVELPGEISGELKKPAEWSGTTLNSMAYGYEVGVTPIQIAAAYAAIANGGTLYRPYLIKQTMQQDGTPDFIAQPQAIRRVISPGTAKLLTQFFTGVVERGTGKEAKNGAVNVAGKTGTSRKVIDGQYVPGTYTATFAGFFPVDQPKVVCVVMLDTRATSYSGGRTSAPIFRRIAERVVGLPDRFFDETIAQTGLTGGVVVPDVLHLKSEDARTLLEAEGLDVELIGEGAYVEGQSPGPGSKTSASGRVKLRTTSKNRQEYVVVPDLRSLSARRAMNKLGILQLQTLIRGSGIVVNQHPRAGEKVARGSAVHLSCEPALPLAAALN
jgi:cell division protein FtsI (penicillin-binding protein 3)